MFFIEYLVVPLNILKQMRACTNTHTAKYTHIKHTDTCTKICRLQSSFMVRYVLL